MKTSHSAVLSEGVEKLYCKLKVKTQRADHDWLYIKRTILTRDLYLTDTADSFFGSKSQV